MKFHFLYFFNNPILVTPTPEPDDAQMNLTLIKLNSLSRQYTRVQYFYQRLILNVNKKPNF